MVRDMLRWQAFVQAVFQTLCSTCWHLFQSFLCSFLLHSPSSYFQGWKTDFWKASHIFYIYFSLAPGSLNSNLGIDCTCLTSLFFFLDKCCAGTHNLIHILLSCASHWHEEIKVMAIAKIIYISAWNWVPISVWKGRLLYAFITLCTLLDRCAGSSIWRSKIQVSIWNCPA